MKTTYCKLNGFAIDVADSGDVTNPASRVIIFRHAALQPEQHDQVEQAPTMPKLVHDEKLLSAALVLLYDELVLEVALRTGRGKAAVIKGRDPLDGMEF